MIDYNHWLFPSALRNLRAGKITVAMFVDWLVDTANTCQWNLKLDDIIYFYALPPDDPNSSKTPEQDDSFREVLAVWMEVKCPNDDVKAANVRRAYTKWEVLRLFNRQIEVIDIVNGEKRNKMVFPRDLIASDCNFGSGIITYGPVVSGALCSGSIGYLPQLNSGAFLSSGYFGYVFYS